MMNNVKWKSVVVLCVCLGMVASPAMAITVTTLAQLRNLGAGSLSNTTITLSATGGDPHPVTGVFTPGQYWINGDHIQPTYHPEQDVTARVPIFMDLGGSGNTYDLSAATIKVDTRDLAGYGRALGHSSGVHLVQLTGNNNVLQGLTLIGEDLDLAADPNAQRYADWGTQYGKVTGDNNTVDGATIVARGSRTDTYGLSDAFGKGASQGQQPYIGHRKAAGFVVDNATNTVVNNLDLTVEAFGHGFFTGSQLSNTTLSNSTITGELFPSQMVLDRPEYQQYGHTWWGYPIQDDIMLSGSEGGVRTYGGTNFTVENVVVDGMRTGFATVATGGDVNITNSYAYNTTSGFDVGDNTTITGSGGNIVNGPLLVFYGSGNNTSIDLELTAGTPIGVNWSAAYFNGNADISIRSDLAAADLPEESYIRLGQRYFENWRDSDFQTATPDSNNPRAFNNQTFVNDTNQILVIGENAVGNVGSSQAPVISNGKENYYDGVSLVQSGSRLEVEHPKGLGNSGTELEAEFSGNNIVYTGTATAQTLDDNGSIVEDGATLELLPGLSITDEKLTITGNGDDGNGALYSDGTVNSSTRFGSSSGSDESTIFLDGDASIGVGIAGNQMLVGRIQGTGNLTKRGAGTLSVEKSSSLSGTLFVSQGTLAARSNVVLGNVSVEAGGTLAPGASAGSLTTGDLALLTGGTLEIEVGGLSAGSEYDQLLSEAVTLGGDLSISLLDTGGGTFMPDFSDTFTILSATSLLGSFDNVAAGDRLRTTGDEGSFLVSYDSISDELLLSSFLVALLGDLDGNDVINSADWTQFKAGSNLDMSGYTEEQAYLSGDLNGDFANDLADFLLFQRYYDAANGTGALAALVAVPEPCTSVLTLFGLVFFLSRNFRHNHS